MLCSVSRQKYTNLQHAIFLIHISPQIWWVSVGDIVSNSMHTNSVIQAMVIRLLKMHIAFCIETIIHRYTLHETSFWVSVGDMVSNSMHTNSMCLHDFLWHSNIHIHMVIRLLRCMLCSVSRQKYTDKYITDRPSFFFIYRPQIWVGLSVGDIVSNSMHTNSMSLRDSLSDNVYTFKLWFKQW